MNALTQTGFLRIAQIVGNPKATPPIQGVIPVSRSTWWAWVRSGKAPQPVKLSERVTAWRSADVSSFVEQLAKEGAA